MLFYLFQIRKLNIIRSHLQTFPFINKTMKITNNNNLLTSSSSLTTPTTPTTIDTPNNTTNTPNNNNNNNLHLNWFETDQEYNIEGKLPLDTYRSNIRLILKNHRIEIKIYNKKDLIFNGLIYIPANVDEQFISARYIDDMIIIALPKLEKSENEKIIDIE